MTHYTYWIIDHVNGMYYHGVHTSDAPEDINAYHGSCKALNEAIRTHGIENFSKRIERIHATREQANEWEIRLHRRLDVANRQNFYNSINARPFMKVEPGPLSETHMQRLFSDESRAKMAEAKRGRPSPKDDAWKKKVSEAKKGRPLTEAHKSALRGVKKTLTDAQRQALREGVHGADQVGTANHFNCTKGDGHIIWKIDNPQTTYFVLNAAAFARQVMGISYSLSAKLAAILRGERTEVAGHTARRPTSKETTRYKADLLVTSQPYAIMNDDSQSSSRQ